MKILVVNGPNLNLLGSREPDIYGKSDFQRYFHKLKERFDHVELEYFQSNIEGEIIDRLQSADGNFDGIVLNAAGYTHTSVAIGDTVKAIKIPVVEVHISNTSAREEFRHKSFIAPHAKGVILGFGLQSYELGILSFLGS